MEYLELRTSGKEALFYLMPQKKYGAKDLCHKEEDREVIVRIGC